jgi:hypothetical protein
MTRMKKPDRRPNVRIFLEVTEKLTSTYTVETYTDTRGWETYLIPCNLTAAVFTDRHLAEECINSAAAT